MQKVNEQNWAQLDFLINNFYEIVEYKRGRGIYGDRVIWKRSKNANAIFGQPEKLYEFYYMDANAVKELSLTRYEKIKIITRMVTSAEDMNILCNFSKEGEIEPSEWALECRRELVDNKVLDYNTLNSILLDRYASLDKNFLEKLQKHRQTQYFLASSAEYNFITKEYADAQLNKLKYKDIEF